MAAASLVALDISRNSFQIHGIDSNGKCVLKGKVTCTKANRFSLMPKCTVAIEAWGGSHYWARKLEKAGHMVELIAPLFVKPFV